MKMGNGIAIAGIWLGTALAIFWGASGEIVLGSTVATCFIAFFQ